MPGGVCAIAFASRARPIWSTRSSSARAQASGLGVEREQVPRPLGNGLELLDERSRDLGEHDLLALDAEAPRVHPRKVEQVGGKAREPVDLLAGRHKKAGAGLLVEIFVRHELEEAGEGEQWRPQLVRRVRDELLARRVELCQLDAHPLECGGELAELVLAVVDDRLVEPPLGDPVRRSLEPADPARVHRRGGAAQDRRDEQREPGRVEESTLHDADGRELILDRRREEEDVPRREQRHRYLARRAGRRVRPVLERSA